MAERKADDAKIEIAKVKAKAIIDSAVSNRLGALEKAAGILRAAGMGRAEANDMAYEWLIGAKKEAGARNKASGGSKGDEEDDG